MKYPHPFWGSSSATEHVTYSALCKFASHCYISSTWEDDHFMYYAYLGTVGMPSCRMYNCEFSDKQYALSKLSLAEKTLEWMLITNWLSSKIFSIYTSTKLRTTYLCIYTHTYACTHAHIHVIYTHTHILHLHHLLNESMIRHNGAWKASSHQCPVWRSKTD